MGLDIFLRAETGDHIHVDNNWDGYRDQHLSRTFCNFMCRQHAVAGEPELDQIGEMTGIDILPIYDMNDYPNEDYISYLMETATNEAEKEEVIASTEANMEKLNGNLDKVLSTIGMLITELSKIQNLPFCLLPTERDTLSREWYFSNFASDPCDGYFGNNFGQDLRNFKRFLDFAKSKGAVTVFFSYG